ncbi:glycosyltransferase [Thalassobius vesicularis]|uniref:Glycosyltransferase n=1 Tax=Thalassobius vesicularis TaxID=1294297 RepID=A0A4S3MDI9_9RHOB|nr:glycosyltransferase family 2 protein [Thalassobius vesicularis]THD76949.1 glycosyltransferase [Thalassobius vesicularis]
MDGIKQTDQGPDRVQEWGHAGRLVAVVVTHNRLDKLKVTVARLLAEPAPLLQAVVVVDNVSTDGTGDWLATQDDPRLVVQTSTANIGGAGGFENGMKLAVERFDPDWLVVMDDDARPEPDALAAFHALAPIQWDGIAAAVYFPDGQICEMNRPSRNPFWHAREFRRTLFGGGRGGFHLEPSAYQGPAQQIDVTSFVGFFISRAGVQRIGYPDGGLFLYGDDGLYTLGLTKAGGRIGFEPSVRFEHDCSTFADQAQRGRFVPLWKVYYYHRNLLLLYRMAAGWLFWPAMALILPKWLLKMRAHAGERGAFLRLMGLGIVDGLLRQTSRTLEDIREVAGDRAGDR